MVGIIPLSIFIKYSGLLNSGYLIILWLLVGIINPIFEEIFWRGFMLDKNENIPFWLKTLIASLLFAIAHPLTWGIFSQNMLSPEMFASVFLMGLIWSFAYRKTNSLILPYFSHLMVDLLSLSVLAFLNLLPVMQNLNH